ncbi:MAG: hypothetical protein KatS3mg129_1631 [Leptospiraceae bacterium]|nr:MAG: hypothetical protein KatS3mg129_1631 [Leptospiraceae bacterium]
MFLIKKPHLLFFPLLIAGIFLIDKIFLLENVRDHFIQPGGMLYYRQRKEQLGILKKYILHNDNKKNTLIIVLGDSRSLGLGQEIANYIKKNELDIWNFAGPQAVPAYYFYIAKKIFKFTKPDYFYIGISPDAFNRNAGIFASPVLNYGVDKEFIETYRTLIPDRDYTVYKKTRLYALAGLQFSFRTLIKRIKGSLFQTDIEEILKKFNINYNKLTLEEKKILQTLYSFREENLSFYNYYKSPQRLLLNMTKGAQYAWFGKMNDNELKKETEKLKNLYLNQFIISQEQLIFLEFLLREIQKNQSKAILFFPRVNPYLREMYKEVPEIQFIKREITNKANQYNFPIIDFNDDKIINCNDYYDASHLSVSCFPDVLRVLLKYH